MYIQLIMEFARHKSHVTAELKSTFLQSANLQTPIVAVPGIGSVTAERLKKENIRTIGDLTSRVNSFADLKDLCGKVNCHRIFDCLEPFLENCKAEYDAQPAADVEVLERAMKKFALVDPKEDKALAKEASKCVVC